MKSRLKTVFQESLFSNNKVRENRLRGYNRVALQRGGSRGGNAYSALRVAQHATKLEIWTPAP